MHFAFELYLKALYVAATKKRWKRVHELDLMYAALPEPLRASVAEGWCRARSGGITQDHRVRAELSRKGVPVDLLAPFATRPAFERHLRRSSLAFVNWRYLFEGGDSSVGVVLDAMPTMRLLVPILAAMKLPLIPQGAATAGHHARTQPSKARPESTVCPDPLEILKFADDFARACEGIKTAMWPKLEEGREGDPQLFDPCAALTYFTVELYLKGCYVATRKEKYPNWHRLDELFKALPESTKDSLTEGYAKAINPDAPIDDAAAQVYRDAEMPEFKIRQLQHRGTRADLEKELAKAATGFVDWRYSFETKELKMGNVLPMIGRLRTLIMRHAPGPAVLC
ncbi:MAG: hypothetical protein EOO73_36245 [Myxococcales bacterium]|nr:MAG: hypothetical protein EOO73_36245 [Myxococcales bacterium]